jgi:hypothetical protein
MLNEFFRLNLDPVLVPYRSFLRGLRFYYEKGMLNEFFRLSLERLATAGNFNCYRMFLRELA